MAALVLSVNPDLRWQEVCDILQRAGDRIDPQGGAYDGNGHSFFYGYGRLHAETAVKLARPTPRNSVVISRNFTLPLPDLQTVSAAMEVGETNTVESLTVQVEILHTYIGDLVVTLVPPTGLNVPQIVLHNRKGGATRNLTRTYDAVSTPSLTAFHGKSLKGTWKLQIRDTAVRDEGTLVRYALELVFPPSALRHEAESDTVRPPAPRRRTMRSKALR